MKTTHVLVVTLLGLSAASFVGCTESSVPTTPRQQDALKSESRAALDKMYDRDPGLKNFVDRAYGYAIFPAVGKGGVILGGSAGRGEVYEQGRLIGYAKQASGTVGAQIGGQEFAELIVFENEPALRKFADSNSEAAFTMNASAVAIKAGASDEAHFKDGIALFTLPTGGLMAEASIGAQSFKFVPLDATDNVPNAYNANYRSDPNMSDRNHGKTEYRKTETEIRHDNP